MRFSEIISENKKGCPCCGCATKTKCTCPPDCPDCDCHNVKEAKATSQRLDPKCWKGYKKQGTKVKGGVRVNNCVPVSEDTQTFDHVSNKRLRRILVSGAKNPAEVEWAMDFTHDALMADYDDEILEYNSNAHLLQSHCFDAGLYTRRIKLEGSSIHLCLLLHLVQKNHHYLHR